MTQKLSYGGNLNYPNYGMDDIQPSYQLNYSSTPPLPPSGVNAGDAGSMLDDLGNTGASIAPYTGPAAPIISGASAVSKLAGTGLKIYDKMNNADEAEAHYKKLMAEWERQKRIADEDRAREIKRQKLKDSYYGAAQSAGLEDRFASAYPGYRIGG